MHGNYEVYIFLVPMFVCIGIDPLPIYLSLELLHAEYGSRGFFFWGG